MARSQQKKRRTAPSRIRLVLIPVLAALVLGALALGSFGGAFPRLEAAGFRIPEEEYLRAMYEARNDVLSDHAAAGISLKDWHTETALGDPVRLTMERALAILGEHYAVSTLAVERGYLMDAGYDALVRELEDYNRQRQEALQSGQIITGIPSFTMDDYLHYRTSSLRLQFCNDPQNPEYQVTPQEILDRYEADRDDLYRRPDELELRVLLADAAPGEADALAQAFQKARDSGDLAAAAENDPLLRSCYQELSVTAATYSIYARSHGDVLSWAAELQKGEISRVFSQEDRLCVIECVNRTVRQYAPLEDVESIVVQSIRESRYDALVAELMEASPVRGDLQKLYRFTAAQFPRIS